MNRRGFGDKLHWINSLNIVNFAFTSARLQEKSTLFAANVRFVSDLSRP
jgi:hypothetical protein